MVLAKDVSFNCKSCNNFLLVKSNRTDLLVCDRCQDLYRTLYATIHPEGKSYVPEDLTLLQLETTGVFGDKMFRIIGRKRLQLEGGFYRNDWFLMFNDNSTGWLYESLGSYTIAADKFEPLNYDQVKNIEVAHQFTLPVSGKTYYVERMEKVKNVEFEGELPFDWDFKKQGLIIETIDENNDVCFFELIGKTQALYTEGQRVQFEHINFLNTREANEWKY